MLDVNPNREFFSLPASGSGFLILPLSGVPEIVGGFLPLEGATVVLKTLKLTSKSAV